MFEKVITLLINPDQTDFIQSRYIEQNIRPINDILEQIKLCYISDILLQLDFQKKLLIQLKGNLYKEPLHYLILGKAFNDGFP